MKITWRATGDGQNCLECSDQPSELLDIEIGGFKSARLCARCASTMLDLLKGQARRLGLSPAVAWPFETRVYGPPEGCAVVPIEPKIGLLTSMAFRCDHGLMIPGYYDQPLLKETNGCSHADMVSSALKTMGQLHEEVVGKGFYKPENEDKYVKALEQLR